MGFWKRAILDALIFIAIAGFFPQMFHVSSILMAFVAAVVTGLLNRFVKPIIVLFSLPITILTFGLFYICINAFMLQLASWALSPNFYFSNFGSAVIVAVIISIVNMIVSDYFSK
ncbi:phage holin family protein [Ligilactobacillus sp. LYQ135]